MRNLKGDVPKPRWNLNISSTNFDSVVVRRCLIQVTINQIGGRWDSENHFQNMYKITLGDIPQLGLNRLVRDGDHRQHLRQELIGAMRHLNHEFP